jgi:hypothetical protein
MAIHEALLGHGVFTEFSVVNVLNRYKDYRLAPDTTSGDNIDRFIQALKDMQIASVWVQLFTRSGDCETRPASVAMRKDLLARLVKADIQWAGWGYCAGSNWDRDIGLIRGFARDLGMSAFVIDAEPEEKKDVWSKSDFDDFTKAVNTLMGTQNLGLSTWPVLRVQDSKANPVIELMKIAAPRVCLFAPQAYWMNFPSKVHYNLGFKPSDYPKNDPTAYVRLVIDSWQHDGFTNPLLISGQSYWGEGSPSMKIMEAKVAQFITTFANWSKIVGFNWYHGGMKSTPKSGAMSDAMIASIIAGRLGTKPYQTS